MEYTYNAYKKEAVSTVVMATAIKERHSDRMGERRLTITTSKGYRSGTLITQARVSFHGDGFMSHAFGLGSGGDYSAEIITTPCARVTQKAICTQHANASKDFQRFLDDATAYYAAGKDAQ